ncbi:MAG: hypothetical protein A3E01_09195 [Gammaproteobacteria bacterium RIFCSPHIGHO2_12_FULL_63_22]|nr:MAG: hypothetical protein A3E01_09195 [Gammaproteobacteria bacterium RIFCSPHIGHO2_12_FULL_63_22]
MESVISGGVALSGEEDVIATDGGGRWEIAFEGVTLRTPAQIKAWEAWEGYLGRGKTDCLVPILSLAHANRPVHGRLPLVASKLVYDDPVFPTSVAYSASAIAATIGAAAALRATIVAITVAKGAALVGGEKFSVGGRGYRVVRPLGAGFYQIEPPLREAVSAGATCIFDWPFIKCRSAPGESWSPALQFGRRGEASIRFLENAA